MGFQIHFLPQPLSPGSTNPLDCIILCSSILDSTLVVNKDQVVDRVDVAQPTCIVIYDEYD